MFYLLTFRFFCSAPLQLSSGVESLRLTQVSVRTPCLEDLGVRVTSGRTTSTASQCRSSSPSCFGPSRTATAATAPPTLRRRYRRRRAARPSWASTASVSWPPASSSAPSSGPETSRTFQNSPSQSRSVRHLKPIMLNSHLAHFLYGRLCLNCF